MFVTRPLLIVIPFALAFGEPPTNVMASIPLHFEPNLGQVDSRVSFTARSGGLSVFLTPSETVFARPGDKPVRMKLRRSRVARYEAMNRLPGVSNYYRGNDPKKWREGVPHYKRVRAKSVYEGVDVVYYGNARRLEYDFVVAPGADPSKIELAYEGTESMRVDRDGDLVLMTKSGELRQHKPVVYQEVDGRRVEVAGSYRIRGASVGFELARYDASKPVVIDPILEYGTFLGGGGQDYGTAISGDGDGAIYVAGRTSSPDFPLMNAIDSTLGAPDAFISKINPSGTELGFSTYLGGQGTDEIHGLALNVDSVFVNGYTSSSDFPVRNALQQILRGGSDGFLTRLSRTGSLGFSTYLGETGQDALYAIALSSTSIAVAGLRSAPDSTESTGIVIRVSLDGSSRISSKEAAGVREFRGVAIDGSNAVYVIGTCVPGSSVGTVNSLFPSNRGGTDAIVAKLNPSGDRWDYVTHLGGQSDDTGRGIALGDGGRAFVTGSTQSPDFPLRNAIDSVPGSKAFVAAIDPAGSGLVFSTYFGGSGADTGDAAVGASTGDVIVAGTTRSWDFPLLNSWRPLDRFSQNSLFVAKFSPEGVLRYSSLHAEAGPVGLGVTPAGAPLLTGRASLFSPGNPDFVTANAYSPFRQDDASVFVARFRDGPSPVQITIASSPPGRKVRVDGRELTAPATVLWQPGTWHLLDTDPVLFDDPVLSVFNSWSHGGAIFHRISAPPVPTTYTVNHSVTSCTYSFNPASIDVPSSTPIVAVQLNTQDGCPWPLLTYDPWLASGVASGPFTGPRRLSIRTGVNTGGTRTGGVQARTARLDVTQRGAQGTLPPPALSLPALIRTRSYQMTWPPVTGAAGYEVIVLRRDSFSAPHELAYSGRHSGLNATSTTITITNGLWDFYVRACGPGGFGDSNCGRFASAAVTADLTRPIGITTISTPSFGQILSTSTHLLSWTPAEGATSYDVSLANSTGQPLLRIRTAGTSTVFTMGSSESYQLRVVPCSEACGLEATSVFSVRLPPLGSSPPAGLVAKVANGNTISASWNQVAGADLYRVQVVQAGAGPGGGALTVAARQVSTTSVSLSVPAGPATLIVNACNGDGCGGPATVPVNPAGPNGPLPVVATPMPVVIASGPIVTISWGRIAGDNGSNTDYRLYVGDLSRDGPALDVITKNNFYGAYLLAEGRRYDALVFATQNGVTGQGPASGFMVGGTSATAPSITSPTHNSTFAQRAFRLAWSPMPGTAPRYQYYVARQGQAAPVLTGITTGLFIDTTLPVTVPTQFQAIVRMCDSEECTLDSDAGWGPWSNTVTGTTTFTITP